MGHRPDLSMPDPLRAMLRPGNVLAGSLSGDRGTTIGGLIAGRGQVDRSRREGRMAIRKRLSRRVLFTGAAAAVAVGASAGVALAAAITFTISPGGAITASAGTTTLKDTNTGSVLTCKTSNSSGTLKKGSGIPGTNLGSITALSFNT